MANYKLVIEYNGDKFFGSQIQEAQRTVQGELNKGLREFLKQETIETNFSSRTDAGVHAVGQVLSFQVDSLLDLDNPGKLLIALNNFLPEDLAATAITQVDDKFHARYDAKSRTYVYKIFNRRYRPVLRLDSLLWVKEPLDYALMADFAKTMLGVNDFSAYTKDKEGEKSMICNVLRSELIQESDICFKYYIQADHFLRHMVRRIVGDMINVGRGASADGSYTAPAQGLCLLKVGY